MLPRAKLSYLGLYLPCLTETTLLLFLVSTCKDTRVITGWPISNRKLSRNLHCICIVKVAWLFAVTYGPPLRFGFIFTTYMQGGRLVLTRVADPVGFHPYPYPSRIKRIRIHPQKNSGSNLTLEQKSRSKPRYTTRILVLPNFDQIKLTSYSVSIDLKENTVL